MEPPPFHNTPIHYRNEDPVGLPSPQQLWRHRSCFKVLTDKDSTSPNRINVNNLNELSSSIVFESLTLPCVGQAILCSPLLVDTSWPDLALLPEQGANAIDDACFVPGLAVI
jgi:hypothetical protein